MPPAPARLSTMTCCPSASASRPLTARVTVNRVWQAYFGLGLVETENDFGVQTPPPSHPALLDWLASEFMRPGGASDPSRRWNLKALHRQIVLSSTYRQASARRPARLSAPRDEHHRPPQDHRRQPPGPTIPEGPPVDHMLELHNRALGRTNAIPKTSRIHRKLLNINRLKSHQSPALASS